MRGVRDRKEDSCLVGDLQSDLFVISQTSEIFANFTTNSAPSRVVRSRLCLVCASGRVPEDVRESSVGGGV